MTFRTDPRPDAEAPLAAVPASNDLGDGDHSPPTDSTVARVDRRFARARAAWPARRVVVLGVLAPALAAALAATPARGLTDGPPGWLALVVLIAVACSATLASYVPQPGAGWRLDVGCTPCASVAALSVGIAVWVLHSNPLDVPTALLALAVALFGLRQRLANPSTCAV
ncbi:hypothetical protein [Pengzhenrongella phosphoraccumulans]|uniref:hypothetical protein n=1 Tax=Pengzhenrongella phosphoraccumulans TaxID=3114394 RepID=UPI003890E211